jgi:hypothetical protein
MERGILMRLSATLKLLRAFRDLSEINRLGPAEFASAEVIAGIDATYDYTVVSPRTLVNVAGRVLKPFGAYRRSA